MDKGLIFFIKPSNETSTRLIFAFPVTCQRLALNNKFWPILSKHRAVTDEKSLEKQPKRSRRRRRRNGRRRTTGIGTGTGTGRVTFASQTLSAYRG
jgi:hypothetical protein